MGVTAVRPVKKTTLTCELNCRKTYCMKLNKHKSEFHPLVEKAENLTQPSWNTKPPAESLRACVYKRSHCIILDWITSFSNKKYSTAPWISRTCVMLELNHNVNPTHKKIQEFSRHKKGVLRLSTSTAGLVTGHWKHITLSCFSPDRVFHPVCFSKHAPGSPDRREMTNQLAAAAMHRCLQQTANSLVWTSSLWRSATAITSTSQDFTWNIIRTALHSLNVLSVWQASITAAVNCSDGS